MNGATDGQMAALRQEYDQMRQIADLTQATDTVWRLAREVGGFDDRVTALRQGGYLFTQGLADDSGGLRDRWRKTEAEFDRALREARYDIEHGLDRVDTTMRSADLAPDEGSIQLARTEIQSLARRVREEQQRLAAIYGRDERDINALDRRLDAIEWSLQQIRAASFQLDSAEAVILAAPAEWTEAGADRRDMDGVLYLTDRRLLFERKERSGAFLGIFGGKTEQALTWAAALSDIEDVRAEDRGILGAKQMLFLRSRPAAGQPEISVELKANSDTQEWADFIRQAKLGGYKLGQ